MPTTAKGARRAVLVDTSVAVALLVEDHEGHERTLDSVHGQRLGLAGHAFFETYSVLTRLPAPARRTAVDAAELLAHNFPGTRFLPAESAARLASRLPGLGIAGGAVYDALVGGVAAASGAVLLTRDTRALDTYRALEVRVRLLD